MINFTNTYYYINNLKLLFFLIFYSLTLFTFKISNGDTLSRESKQEIMVDVFIDQTLPFIKEKKGLKSIREIGKLLHDETKKTNNPYDVERQIEFHTLKFDGLEIYGNLLPNSHDTFFPIRVTIYNKNWKIYKGLSVGTPAEAINHVLGAPNRNKGKNIEYCGETDCVVFTIMGGKIEKIEFIFYAD